MSAPEAFPETAPPFKRSDTAIPRWAADRIRTGRGGGLYDLCASVMRCYVDHTGPAPRWFIETLCDGNHPADEWELVTVAKQESKDGHRGTLFTYSIEGDAE